MGRRLRQLPVVALAGLVACTRPAPSPTPEPGPAPATKSRQPVRSASEPAPDDAALRLSALEHALVGSDVRVRFDVNAEGALKATFRGQLVLVGDRVELRASGAIGPKSLELELTGDGEMLRGGNVAAGPRFELPQPPHTREALALDLTRVGLLPDIVSLVGGRPPDGAARDLREWARVDDVAGTGEVVVKAVQDSAPTLAPITFSLVLAGNPSGRVTLWTDPTTGAPVERHQIVGEGDQQLRILEVYQPMETP